MHIAIFRGWLSQALELIDIGICDDDLETGQVFEDHRYGTAFGFKDNGPHTPAEL